MTYEIKRVDLLTVFKASFLVYLAVGFLLGILYGLILMKMVATFSPLIDSPMFEDMGQMGFIATLTLALFSGFFMAIIWSVITVIAAGIYNVMAGFVGGLKLELTEVPDFSNPRIPSSVDNTPPPSQGGISG